MGGGSIKKLSCGLLPSHLRSQTALRLCASTFGRAQTLQRRQKRPTAPVVFYLSDRRQPGRLVVSRSGEHTSELQSHSDLVCRLLLEKKKQPKRSDIAAADCELS